MKDEVFGELLDLSLKRAVEIMKLKVDPTDKNFARLLSSQQAIIASVFSTTVRTNEEMLRKRQDDRMAELLETIEKERARRR